MIVQKEHAESCKCASDDLLGSRRVRPLGKKGKGFAEKLKDLRGECWLEQPARQAHGDRSKGNTAERILLRATVSPVGPASVFRVRLFFGCRSWKLSWNEG